MLINILFVLIVDSTYGVAVSLLFEATLAHMNHRNPSPNTFKKPHHKHHSQTIHLPSRSSLEY